MDRLCFICCSTTKRFVKCHGCQSEDQCIQCILSQGEQMSDLESLENEMFFQCPYCRKESSFDEVLENTIPMEKVCCPFDKVEYEYSIVGKRGVLSRKRKIDQSSLRELHCDWVGSVSAMKEHLQSCKLVPYITAIKQSEENDLFVVLNLYVKLGRQDLFEKLLQNSTKQVLSQADSFQPFREAMLIWPSTRKTIWRTFSHIHRGTLLFFIHTGLLEEFHKSFLTKEKETTNVEGIISTFDACTVTLDFLLHHKIFLDRTEMFLSWFNLMSLCTQFQEGEEVVVDEDNKDNEDNEDNKDNEDNEDNKDNEDNEDNKDNEDNEDNEGNEDNKDNEDNEDNKDNKDNKDNDILLCKVKAAHICLLISNLIDVPNEDLSMFLARLMNLLRDHRVSLTNVDVYNFLHPLSRLFESQIDFSDPVFDGVLISMVDTLFTKTTSLPVKLNLFDVLTLTVQSEISEDLVYTLGNYLLKKISSCYSAEILLRDSCIDSRDMFNVDDRLSSHMVFESFPMYKAAKNFDRYYARLTSRNDADDYVSYLVNKFTMFFLVSSLLTPVSFVTQRESIESLLNLKVLDLCIAIKKVCVSTTNSGLSENLDGFIREERRISWNEITLLQLLITLLAPVFQKENFFPHTYDNHVAKRHIKFLRLEHLRSEFLVNIMEEVVLLV